jgi:PAS domain S-box-containing protein
MEKTVLIVDDEESIRFAFKSFLSRQNHTVFEAPDFNRALEMISSQPMDVVFSDIVLNEYSGIDLLRHVKEQKLDCIVIMITGQPDVETACQAVRLGAFDYLVKPIDKEMILKTAKMAFDFKALRDEKIRIRKENVHIRTNLEAVFRSVNEGIISLDNEGNIVNANSRMADLSGIPANELKDKHLRDIRQRSPLFDSEPFKAILGGQKPPSFQTICRIPDDARGDKTLALNSAALMDRDGSSIGTVVTIRDETRVTALEKQLKERYRFHKLIGKSRKMQQIYQLIESLSRVDTTVLITGESGTGKELVAGAIHYNGTRAGHPFVCLNCSALSENLLESELFGHVKGAFTSAVGNRAGRFQKAQNGSIFLDEIGDVSPAIQLKLLRVLQEKKFERVGDATPMDSNVRVIAATNKDLKTLIQKGLFREDLFYRLKVVEMRIPPLRERSEDIPLLVDHFIDRFNTRFNRRIKEVTHEVLDLFMKYSWPGNVRELEHAIEHAFVLCSGLTISKEHLPLDIVQSQKKTEGCIQKAFPVSDDQIVRALEEARWNKTRAAQRLGICRQTLYRRMKKNKLV